MAKAKVKERRGRPRQRHVQLRCPECKTFDSLAKAGFAAGKQRYHCCACSIHTIRPIVAKPRKAVNR